MYMTKTRCKINTIKGIGHNQVFKLIRVQHHSNSANANFSKFIRINVETLIDLAFK